MAGEDRASAQHLIEQLAETPYAFDFFQAVRRLECVSRDSPRVGASTTLRQDPIRFGQLASLAFASSTIAGFAPGVDGAPPKMTVNFLGLLGPNGPMPHHWTEFVMSRQLPPHKDSTLADFLDIFHNRLIALFYRAWAAHQPTVWQDRPDDDRCGVDVASLLGLGLETMRNRDSIPDNAKLHYAGHLASQTRHETGLRSILRDDFGLPVTIEQFVAEWIEIPAAYHCRLGESRETGTLGQNVIAGRRVWDCQQKFRIVFGPLDLEDFERFLPGGRSYRRLVDWVRLYIGQRLDWDVQLILEQAQVPPVRLGVQGRLGWSTWLTSRPLGRDADDLILRAGAA